MPVETQHAKAEHFRRLHQAPPILVLPNAWDAGSARIFEQAGFPALGTTSAGVAFALGRPDGQRISRSEMLEAVRRITSAVHIPVTADIEAGYGKTIEEVVDTVKGVIAAGAAGINLLFAGSTSPCAGRVAGSTGGKVPAGSDTGIMVVGLLALFSARRGETFTCLYLLFA